MLHLPIQCQLKSADELVNQFIGVVVGDLSQLGIKGGGLRAFMSHFMLDRAQVQTCFNQMSTVAVTKTVGADGFVDPTGFEDGFDRLLHTATIHHGCRRLPDLCRLTRWKDEPGVSVC